MPGSLCCCSQACYPLGAILVTHSGLTAVCCESNIFPNLDIANDLTLVNDVVFPWLYEGSGTNIELYNYLTMNTYTSVDQSCSGTLVTQATNWDMQYGVSVTLATGNITISTVSSDIFTNCRFALTSTGSIEATYAKYASNISLSVASPIQTVNNAFTVCDVASHNIATGGTITFEGVWNWFSWSPSGTPITFSCTTGLPASHPTTVFTNAGGTGTMDYVQTLGPDNRWFLAKGPSNNTLSLFANSGPSSINWVTITSATSGTGAGTLSYSVAVNSSGLARFVNIYLNGNYFTVQQNA